MNTQTTSEEVHSQVERLARGLRRASSLLVVSCVLGIGMASAVACHFLLTIARPISGCELWESALAGFFGKVVGLGISLPFFVLFRLQAALAEIDVRTEEHALSTKETTDQVARSIQEIAEAGMSGEWRLSSIDGLTDSSGPLAGMSDNEDGG